MQPTGLGPGFMRVVANASPNLLEDLLVPGRVLDAQVVSVFQHRAMLSFGRNRRLEVQLQVPLQEGQKIKVQVQSREQSDTASGSRASFVLKLVSPGGQVSGHAGGVPGPGGGHIAGQPATNPGAPSQAALPMASEAAAQAQPGSQQGLQPGAAQFAWIYIPLPDGRQGWAQIHVQEDPPRRTPEGPGSMAHHLRLWWETPSLGSVQITVDALGPRIAALLTAQSPETVQRVERSLHELQTRLEQAGFPETKVGARQALPGEAVEPLGAEGSGYLDRRM